MRFNYSLQFFPWTVQTLLMSHFIDLPSGRKEKKPLLGSHFSCLKIPLGGFDFQSRHFLLRFIRFGGSQEEAVLIIARCRSPIGASLSKKACPPHRTSAAVRMNYTMQLLRIFCHIMPIRYAAGWAFFCAFLAAALRRPRSDSQQKSERRNINVR